MDFADETCIFGKKIVTLYAKSSKAMKQYLTLLIAGLLCSLCVHADVRATGVVLSEDDEPLVGASVQVQGTTLGTVTDADGRFELQVEDDALLVFSYVGYVERVLPASKVMQVVLKKAEVRRRDLANRFAIWGQVGMSSPMEAYTTPGKFGSYSYVSGGIGIGYHLRYKRLLAAVGAEAMSVNFKVEGAAYNTTYNVDARTVDFRVPVMAGMELEHWYWLMGCKFGFYNITYLFNKHEDWKNLGAIANFTVAPAAEIGLNFDRPQKGTNYKLALTAETLMDPNIRSLGQGWWMYVIMGAKFTIALDAQ